jgi:ELP3 family radical SAM enzyme/protein acetyltransferase
MTSCNINKIIDIEDQCKKLPQEFKYKNMDISEENYKKYEFILNKLLEQFKLNPNFSQKDTEKLFRKYSIIPSKPSLTQVYTELLSQDKIEYNEHLKNNIISKKCRRISGVTVVTIFLSPYPNGQSFSCKWDCFYCPNEPGQPRSYLFAEPGVLRANQNQFDTIKQMHSRLNTYKLLGHPTDKLEILILGGTIYSYPKSYLENFFTDIFYAANIFDNPKHIKSDNLQQEQLYNEFSKCRIIGVTVETRPDCINPSELQDFRNWGVTRVQLGVQHTDDTILKKINRKCYHKDTLKAVQLLRDNCFKFDIHLMPNLPGTTPEKDKQMFDTILTQVYPDQVKIYPTMTTPFTKILEDYKKGKYIPYSADELLDVVVYWMTRVHPWIRNNRIVRDIPANYIVDNVSLEYQSDDFHYEIKKRGYKCKCIRCRESGRNQDKPSNGEIVVRKYQANHGTEYFISFESKIPDSIIEEDYNIIGYNEHRDTLFGFVRLRIHHNTENIIFDELQNCALIRELHVYGNTLSEGQGNENKNESQHLGIGKKLMMKAEEIALQHNFKKIAVISGNSVRNYYRKLGYELVNTFMIKHLKNNHIYNFNNNIIMDSLNLNFVYILNFIMIIMFIISYFFVIFIHM